MKINKEQVSELKIIIESLAEGKDPTTGIDFSNDTILNNRALKHYFNTTVELLDKILKTNSFDILTPSKSPYKDAFHILPGEDDNILLSDEPISISRLTYIMNNAVDEIGTKKLRATQVTNWLVEKGYLTQVEDYKIATKKGEILGITTIIKVNSCEEEYSTNLYNRAAQTFIIDHINEITGYYTYKLS